MHAIKTNKNILRILDLGKNLKAEILIIPRILTQTTYQSSLLGISYDSVITLSDFQVIKEMCLDTGVVELWEDKSLPYIALYTKDINEYIKVYSDTMAKDDTAFIEYFIWADEYSYGVGTYKIATILAIKAMIGDKGVEHGITCVPPYMAMNSINSMQCSILGGEKIVNKVDVTNDEKLRLIIDSKASFGAGIWIPTMPEIDKKQGPYYISLMPTILNVSKGDSIYFSIYDNLKDWTGSFFIAEFEVVKYKKKCTIKTQMLIMKIY